MGLVLDSSILIAAERAAQPVGDLLARLRASQGPVDIVLSAISVIELEHGLWRANTPQIAERRRRYVDAVFAAIPVEPFTREMGQLMAKIDAEARKNSLVIPFADLQIGVTALHFDHGIVTWNVRHFKMIPGLRVVQPE